MTEHPGIVPMGRGASWRKVPRIGRGRHLPDALSDREFAELASRVIKVLGGTAATSRLLAVPASQTRLWRTSDAAPPPPIALALINLDQVIDEAAALWPDRRVINDWLTGSNAHLGGATPLDVIRLRGTEEVFDALAATASGAYA